MTLCCGWSPACTTELGLVHETKNSWLLEFAEMFSLEISNLVLCAWYWNSAVSVTSSSSGRFVGVLVMKLKLLCSPRAGLLDDEQRAATSRERYDNSKSLSGW